MEDANIKESGTTAKCMDKALWEKAMMKFGVTGKMELK